jgi:hypothetical protein
VSAPGGGKSTLLRISVNAPTVAQAFATH